MKTYRSNEFNSRSFFISFTFLVLLVLAGIILNFFFPIAPLSPPKFPYNLSILILLTSTLYFLFFKYRLRIISRWLSGTPAALSAIFGYGLTIVSQNWGNLTIYIPDYFGINKNNLIFSDWVIFLLQLYLFVTLTFSVLKKIHPFTNKNIPFIAIHAGTWIIAITLWLSPSDCKICYLNLLENNNKTNIGQSKNGLIENLSFEIQLIDFSISGNDTQPSVYQKVMPFLVSNPETSLKMNSLIIINNQNKIDTLVLRYNRPVIVNGWQLTQYGYDENKGSASTLSIILAQKDPWKYVLYSGIIFLFLGLLLHLTTESLRRIWIQ